MLNNQDYKIPAISLLKENAEKSKANNTSFPTKIAFILPISNESKSVVDVAGAENLLAYGDMKAINLEKFL